MSWESEHNHSPLNQDRQGVLEPSPQQPHQGRMIQKGDSSGLYETPNLHAILRHLCGMRRPQP